MNIKSEYTEEDIRLLFDQAAIQIQEESVATLAHMINSTLEPFNVSSETLNHLAPFISSFLDSQFNNIELPDTNSCNFTSSTECSRTIVTQKII